MDPRVYISPSNWQHLRAIEFVRTNDAAVISFVEAPCAMRGIACAGDQNMSGVVDGSLGIPAEAYPSC